MTTRITVALVAVLGLVGVAIGQPAAPARLVPPPVRPGLTTAPVADAEPIAGPDEPANLVDPFWATGDYMMGWVNGMHLPPLATTSPAGTPRVNAGVLGQPGTTVVIGDVNANKDMRSGGRVGVGYWFDDCRSLCVEAGYFLLDGQSSSYQAASNGTAILARPFFDAATNNPVSTLAAFPGLTSGSVAVQASSSNFQGAPRASAKASSWRSTFG